MELLSNRHGHVRRKLPEQLYMASRIWCILQLWSGQQSPSLVESSASSLSPIITTAAIYRRVDEHLIDFSSHWVLPRVCFEHWSHGEEVNNDDNERLCEDSSHSKSALCPHSSYHKCLNMVPSILRTGNTFHATLNPSRSKIPSRCKTLQRFSDIE